MLAAHQYPKREPDYLTTAEVAQRWRMAPKTLSNWRALGKGPDYIKFSPSLVLYSSEVIAAYESEHFVTAQ